MVHKVGGERGTEEGGEGKNEEKKEKGDDEREVEDNGEKRDGGGICRCERRRGER